MLSQSNKIGIIRYKLITLENSLLTDGITTVTHKYYMNNESNSVLKIPITFSIAR